MRFCILFYRKCACLLYLTDGTFTRFEQIKDISRPIMFYAKSGAESFWYTYIRAARQRSEIRNRAPRAQKKPVGRFKRQVVSGALCRSTVYREGAELLVRFCILFYRKCACLLYLTDGTFTRFEQIKDISRPIMFYAKSGAESFWYTYIRAARQRSEIRNRAPRAQKKPVGRFKRQVVSGALCRSTVYREGAELLVRFCILFYRKCACLLYLTDGTFTRFEQIKDISRPIMFYAKSGAESFWYTYIRAARQRSEIRTDIKKIRQQYFSLLCRIYFKKNAPLLSTRRGCFYSDFD